MGHLDTTQFAQIFGSESSSLTVGCRQLIETLDFSYEEITGEPLLQALLGILKRIDDDHQVIGAEERTQDWFNGWNENLEAYRGSNHDPTVLTPKFIRANQPMRLNQKLIIPTSREFELNFVKVYRRWFLETWFSNVDHIFEFGCGTGHNLLAAAELFPEKQLHGSDFVQPAVDLVNEIAKVNNLKLKADLFNMLEPNYSYEIPPCSGVLTFGSLEQLASQTQPMFDYLLAQSPEIVVHSEPAIELYKENNLLDYLAIKFQGKRGYTKGIPNTLLKLEEEGKIEILKSRRLYLGSLYMEGYNIFVWRPV